MKTETDEVLILIADIIIFKVLLHQLHYFNILKILLKTTRNGLKLLYQPLKKCLPMDILSKYLQDFRFEKYCQILTIFRNDLIPAPDQFSDVICRREDYKDANIYTNCFLETELEGRNPI